MLPHHHRAVSTEKEWREMEALNRKVVSNLLSDGIVEVSLFLEFQCVGVRGIAESDAVVLLGHLDGLLPVAEAAMQSRH